MLVTIKLNGDYIATTRMSVDEIRKAEYEGFQIINK